VGVGIRLAVNRAVGLVFSRVQPKTFAAVLTVAAVTLLAVSGASGQQPTRATWVGSAPPADAPPDPLPSASPVSINSPASGAADIATATELQLSGPGARVTLTDASGATVDGTMRSNGTTWVPATQLQYGTTYTASVTAGGKTNTTTFTTMAKPGRLVGVNTPLSSGKVYGVGLPIVVRFGSAVAPDQRANVERRLFVTTSPAQLGSWYWFSGSEVHYRPREYWQAGTTVSVRLATGGLRFSGNSWGSKDLTLNVTIGDKIMMVIDDATKRMTVTKNDEVQKLIPVSLGKPKTPSSSGHMVVMDKNYSELFVSTDPADPYRETVYWTQRITTGGEYVHAAPWSVGSQGRRNVSHGCTNVSVENAKYLYALTHIGDPVIVRGTPRKLAWGNGWTDWDKSWEEYQKGSALR
jgi:lipoprotein-anchoring transpeptidase ErfK/SrfK